MRRSYSRASFDARIGRLTVSVLAVIGFLETVWPALARVVRMIAADAVAAWSFIRMNQ